MTWYLAKHLVRRLFTAVGMSVRRATACNNIDWARARLIEREGVTCLLDVGASDGRYALALRQMGYMGDIVSFEPGSGSYAALQQAAHTDHKWTTVRAAVGDREGRVTLHLAANCSSSSILQMKQRHLEVAPESRYVGKEQVRMLTIDGYLDAAGTHAAYFLKIDVQGLESAVLSGASHSLQYCRGVELEVSFEELYEHQPAYISLLECLHSNGFVPCLMENVLCDETRALLLQANIVFRRTSRPRTLLQ